MGFDFLVIAPLLREASLWLLICLWMWGIFFGEVQYLPVNNCSAVSCDSGALTRRSESMSFYSTILNPVPSIAFYSLSPLPLGPRVSYGKCTEEGKVKFQISRIERGEGGYGSQKVLGNSQREFVKSFACLDPAKPGKC